MVRRRAIAVVMTMSAAADLVAFFLFRGHRWARWALIALSLITALAGVMSAHYTAPLFVTCPRRSRGGAVDCAGHACLVWRGLRLIGC